jgi:hypothetical protein
LYTSLICIVIFYYIFQLYSIIFLEIMPLLSDTEKKIFILLRRRWNLRQSAIILLIHRRRRRRLQQISRRWWVHPINQQRKRFGAFHVLYPLLNEAPENFFNYFRMNRQCFELLLGWIGPRFFIIRIPINLKIQD